MLNHVGMLIKTHNISFVRVCVCVCMLVYCVIGCVRYKRGCDSVINNRLEN